MVAWTRVVCVSFTVCLALLYFSSAQENVEGKECTCMPVHMCRLTNITENSQNKSDEKPNETTMTTEKPFGNQFILHLITLKIPGEEPETGECHYLELCCFPKESSANSTEITNRYPTLNDTYDECGIRNMDGVGAKIVGTNNEASFGEFPWVVAVIHQFYGHGTGEGVSMECAGTIIHPQVVLTAAHCVRGKNDLYVRAGEWDTQTDKEMYPIQDRDVKQIILHEDYYHGGQYNDAALLVLDSPLELGPTVQTLCLPEEGEVMDGRKCVATGWGKDQYGMKGKYQVILKRVELPIVPQDSCLQQLRETRLGPRFKMHPSYLCAGGEVGKDTCKGDGGGPLMCPSKTDPHIYVQAGIISWGIGCGQGVPGVYANVPYLKPWIESKLESLLAMT